MGIFDFLKRKEQYKFSSEDQQTGALKTSTKYELARRKAELDLQKAELEAERDRLRIEFEIERMKQQLDELKGLDEDEAVEGSSMEDTLLTTLLSNVLAGNKQPVQPITVQPIQQLVSLTDQHIKDYWNSLSKAEQRIAKGMTDKDISTVLLSKIPNIDTDTVERIINFIHKV